MENRASCWKRKKHSSPHFYCIWNLNPLGISSAPFPSPAIAMFPLNLLDLLLKHVLNEPLCGEKFNQQVRSLEQLCRQLNAGPTRAWGKPRRLEGLQVDAQLKAGDASAPQGPWGEGPGGAQLSPSAGWWHPRPSPRDAEADKDGCEQSATSVTGDGRRGPRAHSDLSLTTSAHAFTPNTWPPQLPYS